MFGMKNNKKIREETVNELFRSIFPSLDDPRNHNADLDLATKFFDDVSVRAEQDILIIKTSAGSHTFTYPEASVVYSVLSVLYTKCPIRK